MRREDKLAKYSLIACVIINWIILGSCIYSLKKSNMAPIHYALNLSNLRYILATFVTTTPAVGVNYKERYSLKMIMCAIVTTL